MAKKTLTLTVELLSSSRGYIYNPVDDDDFLFLDGNGITRTFINDQEKEAEADVKADTLIDILAEWQKEQEEEGK